MSPDFVRSVGEILTRTDTDPGCLTLEVTESVLVADEERALTVIRSLKRLGVLVALDDFGTGQSSLTHLKRFPVDTVKIDQSFIVDLQSNSASWLIVEAVVDLAHGLGMTVVAEGVETFQQRDEVMALNCDFSQGFFFSPPESPEELDALLARRHVLPKPNPFHAWAAWPNSSESRIRRDDTDLLETVSSAVAPSRLRKWRREHL
jgi:EAL domain-containing protein (putative c-di-GMP-specific phosphodiesterase class I)